MWREDLPPELDEVVKRFEDACWEDWLWLNQHTPYGAPHFRTMMKARGPLNTVLHLLRESRKTGRPQYGYLHLLEMGLVSRSVEYGCLRLEWRPFMAYFPEEERQAREILRRSGVTPPDEEVRV